MNENLSWQTNWNLFVSYLEYVLQEDSSESRLRQEFEGKQVEWTGVFDEFHESTYSCGVDLCLQEIDILIKGNLTSNVGAISPSVRSENIASWKKLS